MAEKHKYSEAELQAGIFLIFCLALFVAMLIVYGKVSRFWRDRQQVKVVFSSVESLRPDAAVRYNGVEVGRVRSMRIIHMDRKNLDRLLPLNRSHLQGLPVPKDKLRALRLAPDKEFDRMCREAIQGETMIELTLEVLQEGDYRRYRVDDSVLVGTTVMGDAAVEIIAGSGRPLGYEEDVLLVGQSKDFFSSLSRSMDQVKEVLSTVTDIVGVEERQSFVRSANRMDGVMETMRGLGKNVSKRMAGTSKKFGVVEKAGTATMDSFGSFFENIQPDTNRLHGSIKDIRSVLGKRFGDVMSEVDGAEKEMKEAFGRINTDVREARKASVPHFDQMKSDVLALIDRFSSASSRTTRMYRTMAMAGEQSLPEMSRMMQAIENSSRNLASMRYIRERTGEIIGKRDRGEHNINTAVDTYDRLIRISRWPRDTLNQLDELRPWVASTDELLPPVKVGDIDRIRAKIAKLETGFDHATSVVSRVMTVPYGGEEEEGALLPPFRRKGSGWSVREGQ